MKFLWALLLVVGKLSKSRQTEHFNIVWSYHLNFEYSIGFLGYIDRSIATVHSPKFRLPSPPKLSEESSSDGKKLIIIKKTHAT